LRLGAPPPRSVWFGIVRGVLIFSGVAYALLGLVMPLVFFSVSAFDPPDSPTWLLWGISAFSFVVCAGFGALNFVAAWGLDRETKWGWIVSLVLAAMYAPSGCFPLGVLMLIGLLQDDVRKTCLQ
jgi:hypothetical protein